MKTEDSSRASHFQVSPTGGRNPDMPPEFKRASSASEQADQKNQEERNKLLFGEMRAWVCGRLLH